MKTNKIALKRGFDWITLSIYIALLCTGWFMVYASSHSELNGSGIFNLNNNIGKHSLFVIVSLFSFFIAYFIDTKFWHTAAYIVYVFALFLLVAVLIFGSTIKGSTSWFDFGFFSFQPSEFAKFGACLAIASYLSFYKTDLTKWKHVLITSSMIFIPAILILLQPDAGSALVFMSFFILLYREGLTSSLYIIVFFLAGLFIASILFEPGNIVLILLIAACGALLYSHFPWIRTAIGVLVFISLNIIIILFGSLTMALIFSGIITAGLMVFNWLRKKEKLVVILFTGIVLSASFCFFSIFALIIF